MFFEIKIIYLFYYYVYIDSNQIVVVDAVVVYSNILLVTLLVDL